MVTGIQDTDCLFLQPRCGYSGWGRIPRSTGKAVFAFLNAGEYRLTLCRCGRSLCRLLVRLVPGSRVDVWLDAERRSYAWRQARSLGYIS